MIDVHENAKQHDTFAINQSREVIDNYPNSKIERFYMVRCKITNERANFYCNLEHRMTLVNQIQKKVEKLPPDKQSEVLDFVTFLQQQTEQSIPTKERRSLKDHKAFGSWKTRRINALKYEQDLRAEWD